MTEQKHTPGPWHVADDGWSTEVYAADGYEIVDAGQGPHLHETHDGNSGHWATTEGAHVERSEEEERANARLIAAAPDGYELAKGFLAFARGGNHFFYPPGSMQKLEQFVAKVEGR